MSVTENDTYQNRATLSSATVVMKFVECVNPPENKFVSTFIRVSEWKNRMKVGKHTKQLDELVESDGGIIATSDALEADIP